MKESVLMTMTERFILLKMKKDDQDIRFLRTLHYARWDSAAFCWVISRKEENLTMMCNYFEDRLTESYVEEPLAKPAAVSPAPVAESNTLLVVKYHNGRVRHGRCTGQTVRVL